MNLHGIPLVDVYRAVLLVELGTLSVAYLWALRRYIFDAIRSPNSSLRDLRDGQASRIFGCLIILGVLIMAVLRAFGEGDLGRTLTNLLIQVALFAWARAWLMIDFQRFRSAGRHGGSTVEAIIDLVDTVEAEAITRRKRRPRRRRTAPNA
jgi:hypothetical protein